MTCKLRKAAQDVVDEAFYLGQDSNAVHELREALQAVPERVCSCPSGDGSLRWPCQVHPPTPPSVDALIAEIANVYAEPVDDNFWIINKDELYAILDKYRGVK